MASSAKVELAVRMETPCCEKSVRQALTGVEGIKSVAIDTGVDTVLVETTLSSEKVKELIESTGRQAVIRGLGSSQSAKHLGAAVAMMSGSEAKGVIRMVQINEDACVLEGTIDGLDPGRYSLAIHEAGDLSDGCNSCGNILETDDSSDTKYGDLGEIAASKGGRAEFRMQSERVKIWDVIGRSMVIHSNVSSHDDIREACGIIARSAGLFENPKKMCACDGVTIWDERNVPLAGPGRQKNVAQL